MGNFRDLASSITRLSTLATQGRITVELVRAEIERLKWGWKDGFEDANQCTDNMCRLPDHLDYFDRMQLENVISVCRKHQSLAAAGRALFNVSRLVKEKPNDSDRLRKYLAKFGLTWDDVTQ